MTKAQRILVIATTALGAAIYLVMLSRPVRSYRNGSDSMAPTMPKGSYTLVLRSSKAGRGDIVVFKSSLDPHVTLIKRVVGVGGDVVELRSKQLFVNGRIVSEPYLIHTDDWIYPKMPSLPEPFRSRDNFGPFRVPPGRLFVLGDNRDESNDSRFFGTIGRDQVFAHPILFYGADRGVWRP